MANLIRKWAGPRFVERAPSKTPYEIAFEGQAERLRRGMWRDGLQVVLCFFFAAVIGVPAFGLVNFSLFALVAVAWIFLKAALTP